MIVDRLVTFTGAPNGTTNAVPAQTMTGTGATIVATDSIDLGVARDMGQGTDLFGRIQVATAASGGTSVEFQIVSADDGAISSNVTVLGTTGAIPVAQLTQGARFACMVNPRIARLGQRFLGARAITVGAVAAGAYVIDLGLEIQDGAKFYANGFAVL